jgi:hypothetical protein
MSKHVAVQGVEGGIVDVRDQHALAQIIEDDHSDGAA